MADLDSPVVGSVPLALFDGGEMARLIAAKDWSKTALGPMDGWPQSLKNILQIILPARAQIALFWGDEFTALYNDAYVPAIGDKHPAALGRPAYDAWSELWSELEPLFRSVRETGRTVAAKDRPFEIERHGYLETAYFDISFSALPDESGAVEGVLCIVNETTERLQAEKRLKRVLETDAVGVIFFNRDGVVIDANDAFLAMTGYSRDQVNGGELNWRKMTPPEWVELSERELEKLAATGRIGPYEKESLRADGSRQWMLFVGRDLGDGAIAEYCIDTSSAHASAEALRESEERLRLAVDNADVGFWDVQEGGGELTWPARTKAMFGISADVPVSMEDFFRGLHPEDLPRVAEAYAAAADPERRSFYDVEYRTIGKEDGALRWVAAKGRGVFDGPGPDARCIRVIGTAVEITSRRLAEQSARESEARLRAALDASEAGTFRWNIRTNELDWDEALDKLFGLAPGSTARSLDQFVAMVHPDDRAEVITNCQRCAAQGADFDMEFRVVAPDGSLRWLYDRGKTFFGADGQPELMTGACVDVTERKLAETALTALNQTLESRVADEIERRAHTEEVLRQAQKMETVGQLSGGIAHDFNNLLQVIQGNLSLAERALETGDPAKLRRSVANALTGTDRAAALTKRLLAFSRRQPLDARPIDVNALITGMIDLLQRTLGETVLVTTDLSPGLPSAMVDGNQLENALLNLAINARDAMGTGGRLEISTRVADPEHRRRDDPSPSASGYILVEVRDNGYGMSEEVRSRAVEPFFSTKDVGHGTGLGLSMVYGFVRQSGGHLDLSSREGAGTTIGLYLPSTDAVTVAPAPSGSEDSLARGRGERILLCEDDDDVRLFSSEALKDLGYDVVEAHDAASALTALTAERAPDLLFTDVVLPGGRTGADLAREARELHPDLKVLFATGYARTALDREEQGDRDLQVLLKPFRVDQLAAKVREILG